jgi:hypothetical protein
MRIGQSRLACGLLSLVLAPDLRKSKEEALRLCVAIDLVIDRFALRSERIEKRHISDAQAAVVGGIFAQGEFAIEFLLRTGIVRRRRFESAVFFSSTERETCANGKPPMTANGSLSAPTAAMFGPRRRLPSSAERETGGSVSWINPRSERPAGNAAFYGTT